MTAIRWQAGLHISQDTTPDQTTLCRLVQQQVGNFIAHTAASTGSSPWVVPSSYSTATLVAPPISAAWVSRLASMMVVALS